MRQKSRFIWLILFLVASACSRSAGTGHGKGIVVRASYALDAVNFLNLLTDDPFYTRPHMQAYAQWSPRLSDSARAAVRKCAEAHGSNMLGPWLAYEISASPELETADPARLLEKVSDASSLVPVLDELQKKGFRDYWERERLPEIRRKITEMEHHLRDSKFNLEEETSRMLGQAGSSGEPWRIYICAFAYPHGIRLAGPAMISDVRNEPTLVLRIAIHEMFHPPYGSWQGWWTRRRLMRDPLFQEAFRNHDAKRFGYSDESGFLEENIVEAMELHVSQKAGLIDDPWKYLAEHDRGDHRLSVVLLESFNKWPKREDETFAAYLKSVVDRLPRDLRPIYQARMGNIRVAGAK